MSYPETPTFWVNPAGQTARAARRYSRESPSTGWNCEGGFHQAIVWIDRVPTVTKLDLDSTRIHTDVEQLDPDADFWPTHCACTYEFTDADPKQTFWEEIFVDAQGREFTQPDFASHPADAPAMPPGAMFHAYWLPSSWRGEDGIALAVVLPNRKVWLVDSQASNCTRPGDRQHKCWIRHGDPRTGQVTVDKQGETCAAGAGSILSGDYHGFLQQGVLTAG